MVLSQHHIRQQHFLFAARQPHPTNSPSITGSGQLTFRIVIANGKDSRGTPSSAANRIRQVRMPLRIAVLRHQVAGRGAIVSVAADGGRVAPHYLAVMAPAFEPGVVGDCLAVGLGVVFNLVVVEQIANYVGDVAGGDSSRDVLSVDTVACGSVQM